MDDVRQLPYTLYNSACKDMAYTTAVFNHISILRCVRLLALTEMLLRRAHPYRLSQSEHIINEEFREMLLHLTCHHESGLPPR